eukprot:GFUD01024144.1.p1 GENE.GFUD01024144.1~~GFUD01024144.1.p1  ORF type:complete len:519 (-),score=122.85 GFUD01024144.1:270-1826(-)
MMKLLVTTTTIMLSSLVLSNRLPRQVLDPKQIVDVSCSSCEQRLTEKPPQVCCRCIDQGATCNNDIATGGTNIELPLGIACENSIECSLFGDCKPDGKFCKVQGMNVVDRQVVDEGILFGDVVDFRQGDRRKCPSGQKICCNPGPGGGFEMRLGLVSENNPLGEVVLDTQAICEDPKLSAVQDFGNGVTCGKRDSRVYYDADVPDTFTNPGEWPWAVLIFKNGKYIGAGALMDNDVVVTVAHKVIDFVKDPSGLTVRLGDWNPNELDKQEEHPHIEVEVDCVKVHPDADLSNTLANNVAVLKLKAIEENDEKDLTLKAVLEVVDIRSGPRRPANNPEGVEGSSIVKGETMLDRRLGLLSSQFNKDPLGAQTKREVTQSYINTVCLPKNERQFQNYQDNCWVAAWGQDLKRQREVDLPLLSKSECERRLRPVFEERRVKNWRLQPSEICAGGVPGKDTCKGEGGAPLVCYDKASDLYFAVGLVSYGFECNSDKPAVYTSLADPSVKQFITDAFSNNQFC